MRQEAGRRALGASEKKIHLKRGCPSSKAPAGMEHMSPHAPRCPLPAHPAAVPHGADSNTGHQKSRESGDENRAAVAPALRAPALRHAFVSQA